VNAYSSIGKGRGNAVVRRARSRAYRTGVYEGFGTLGLIDAPRVYTHLSGIDASIAGAWKAVGDAIRTASEQKVKQLGKAPSKTESSD